MPPVTIALIVVVPLAQHATSMTIFASTIGLPFQQLPDVRNARVHLPLLSSYGYMSVLLIHLFVLNVRIVTLSVHFVAFWRITQG